MVVQPETYSSTQKVYCDVLPRIGGKFKNLVVLDSNLGSSGGTNKFADIFPERYFNFGNGVSNMFAASPGFTVRGKIPFINAFAISASGRSWDIIRNYLCLPNLNVKIIGSCSGLFCGQDGGTVQATEDIAIMRSIPNMKVICPADAIEAKKVLEAIMDDYGPTYLRLYNLALPVLYDDNYEFKIGKGHVYKEGTDICILAVGSAVHTALDAAEILEREGHSVMVVNMASIAPIDENLIIECAKSMPHLVTVEDHNISGGLGSAVSDVLSAHYPAKLLRIGMNGFGESAKVDDLFKKYKLDGEGISEQIKSFIK
ncbi:transketolase family protein [Pseudomonadota bacterium]